MAYHHNPIEPSDWTEGPDYLSWPECETCAGVGSLDNEFGIEVTCPDCAGSGFVEPDDSRFEDDAI